MANEVRRVEILRIRKALLLAASYLAIAPILLFGAARGIGSEHLSPAAIAFLAFLIGLAGLIFFTGQIPWTKQARENPHWVWKSDKVSSGPVFLALLAGSVGALIWRYVTLEFKLLPRSEAVAYSYCVMASLTMLTAGLLLKDRTDAA